MAIILDPLESGDTTKRLENGVPVRLVDGVPVRIANYPIYPSENPDTPYVPTAEVESWWDGIPEVPEDWNPADNNDEHYQAFLAMQAIEKGNKLVFEKARTGQVFNHSYKNQTYSGVDMVASISLPGQGAFEFADLHTLSVSSHRESFPVRTLGMVNPLGFTSGPRTIGGSLIFSLIEMSPFYKAARDLYGSSAKSLWDDTPAADYPLPDALPPFDITITFNNEYESYGASVRIFGVKIIDDGLTLSVDDLVSENTYSFMAAGIAPVHKAKNWRVDGTSYLHKQPLTTGNAGNEI